MSEIWKTVLVSQVYIIIPGWIRHTWHVGWIHYFTEILLTKSVALNEAEMSVDNE